MAVSNLVTTGGVSTSDLISTQRWTLLTSMTFGSASSEQTLSGLSSYNYRNFKLVFGGYYGTSTGVAYLRINGDSTSSSYQSQGHTTFGTGTSPYNQTIPEADISNFYFLSCYDSIQYGTLQHAASSPFVGEIEISNANSTGDKLIKSTFTYRATNNYTATSYKNGIYKPTAGAAIISSVTLGDTNTTINASGWSYGMKLFGAN